MRICIAIVSTALIAGCANEKVWIKPGATQQEFAQQRFTCMQQSQQQVSVASVGRYGGYAQSGQNTNAPLFNACMSAGGWSLIDKSVDQKLQAEAAPALEEGKSICSRPDLQELFRKIPCLAKDATAEQLADRGKLSPAEKTAFISARQAALELNKKIADIQRQHNPTSGAAIAEVYERGEMERERLATDLTAGRISRGEYNRRRLELHNKQISEMQMATVR